MPEQFHLHLAGFVPLPKEAVFFLSEAPHIIDAILNGSLDNAETFTLPMFNLAIPTELPGVDTKILDPRNTYASPEQWQEKAETLAKLFIDNFDKYTDTPAGAALVAAGPKL